MRVVFSAVVVLAVSACGGAFGPRPYQDPGTDALIAHLTTLRDRVTSLRAETKSDARVGKERANVEVLIMATWGGKLRYQAMNPGGASLAADLASDGQEICFIDANKNCGECGPASPENVSRLVRVPLPPDAVVAVMMGGTPLITPTAKKLTWDSDTGREILELTDAAGMTQRIEVDGRERRWDLLLSELRDAKGKLIWRIRHKDFHVVTREHGDPVRLPGLSLFEQPDNDVRIDWREQALDVAIDEQRAFHLDVPEGLPLCQ